MPSVAYTRGGAEYTPEYLVAIDVKKSSAVAAVSRSADAM